MPTDISQFVTPLAVFTDVRPSHKGKSINDAPLYLLEYAPGKVVVARFSAKTCRIGMHKHLPVRHDRRGKYFEYRGKRVYL